MTRTIEIKADVGAVVSVADLEIKKAVVIGIYIGEYRITYEIAYFHDGDRKSAYLHPHEFEVVTG